MFCLVKTCQDYDIHTWNIIECSENKNDLDDKCEKYNNDVKKYQDLYDLFHQWEKFIQNEWEIAKKFVQLEKRPNRKPDGSNIKIWDEITKRNNVKLTKEYDLFKQDFINLKIPEEIKIFFNPEFNFNNLYCTKFVVVQTTNH